jgi:hypothetical protein
MSLNQASRRHSLATFFGGLFGWFCGSHAAAAEKQERGTRYILPPGPDRAALVDRDEECAESGPEVVWRHAVLRKIPAYETRFVYDAQGRLIMVVDKPIGENNGVR